MYDAIVIGAGLSGLAAARRLTERGRATLVVEARERVGGRTLSVDFGGARVDLGGQWIGPTQLRVKALVQELGLETFREHTGAARLLEADGEVLRFRGPLPPMPALDAAESVARMAQLELLSRRLDPERPWAARRAAALDQKTVASWLEDSVRTKGARRLLRIAAEMVLAEDTTEVSFLFWLWYLRSAQGLARALDTAHGAQQTRFVRGAQEMSLRMAELLGPETVRLSTPVLAVEQNERRVRVRIAGGALEARRVVLALSPALCGKMEFDPALPDAHRRLHATMRMGSVIKCVVGYEVAFWRRSGLSGEAISDAFPVRATFDDSARDGSEPALVAFVVGGAARELSSWEPSRRRAAVLDALARLFGGAARSPVRYLEHDWQKEPWSAGCYTGLLGPGGLSDVGPRLREPVGRVHFAGTETATRWAGYFDGALTAGERAADEVLAALD